MIKTVFIDLALNMKAFGTDEVDMRFKKARELAQQVRPEQEQELDDLLEQGWQIVHTSQVSVEFDNGRYAKYKAAFVLYKRDPSKAEEFMTPANVAAEIDRVARGKRNDK